MNRQQRRRAERLQNNPKVKGFTSKFATELSSILVDHFDLVSKEMEDGKEINLDFNAQTKDLLVKKGEELRKFANDFANQIGKSSRNPQVNKQPIKVNIK